MLLIRHRINTLEELKTVPGEYGIEFDIRSEGSRLILQHDAGKPGEDFETFLKSYRHAFMVVNIKAEGLEVPALELLKKYGVKNYFFLDLSFPALMKLQKTGEKNIAVRFSENEPLEQALALAGKVNWVWVDCFTRLPLDEKSHAALNKHFKICLVSPELQNHPKERIAEFRRQLHNLEIDAVCTKFPELWK